MSATATIDQETEILADYVADVLHQIGKPDALTSDECATMASQLKRALDGFSEHAYCPPDPMRIENDRLSKALITEQSKVGCKPCRGTGRIVEAFGPAGRFSNSQCDKCHGEGKHLP